MKVCELSNGMKVVIYNVNIQEIVSIGMFFGVGSQNETENTNGITHLLEHVIGERFLDDCSRVGGRANAITTKEYCCFFSKCMNSQFEAILECFRQISNGIYSEADILRAKKNVINEIKSLNVNENQDQQIFEMHLGGDPLRFLPIGKCSNIMEILPDAVYAHFKNYIQPTCCVLSIVGSIDEDEGINIVEHIFSDWRGALQRDGQEFYGLRPQQKIHKLMTSNSKTASLRILFDGVSRLSNNKAAYDLMCNFIGGGTHSQLFKQIRERGSMAYNAFCVPQSFSRKGVVYIKMVGISEENETIVERIGELLVDIASKDISLAEFELCKKNILETYIFKHETLSSKMTLLGQQLLLDGYVQTDKNIIDAISRVVPEEIKVGLNQMLSGSISILSDFEIDYGREYFGYRFT